MYLYETPGSNTLFYFNNLIKSQYINTVIVLHILVYFVERLQCKLKQKGALVAPTSGNCGQMTPPPGI